MTINAQIGLQAEQRLVAETALSLELCMRAVPRQDDIWVILSAQITRAECQSTPAPDRQSKRGQQNRK
jgi:hypothetical protein